MANKPQKTKGRAWSFIFPYLVMLLAIGVFVFMFVRGSGKRTDQFTSGNFNSFLNRDDIQVVSVTETPKSTVTVFTGSYKAPSEKDPKKMVTYGFTASISNTDTKSLDEIHLTLSELSNTEGKDEKDVTKYQIVDPYQTSWLETWGPTILLLVGTGIVCAVLFSRMNKSVNSSNNSAMEFNKSRARRIDSSSVHFEDVAGCDAEKAEMVELVDYLKNPKKYTEFGAKLPKGVILVGPPGTGKTLLAKAVAGEAGVPFYSISGSDFVEMFVGVGAGRVRDMFKTAKKNAPCLVFIDEIDAVGRQRGAGLGGGNDEREQTLNQLLVEMDGFSDNSGIIVIAATNREDVLDPALLRAGRFDRKITVGLPDRKGREAILLVHARNKKIDPSVNFDDIAKLTVGFSGADLENVLNEAAILAVRNKEKMISIKDIDEAIDRCEMGPARTSKGMSDRERKIDAYHEAGHAVIGIKLEHSMKVQKITIIPRGHAGGYVSMTPEDDRFLMTKNELVAQIVGLLGGRTSEEIFFNDISTGASHDIQSATRIARSMVTEYGMSPLGPIQYEQAGGSVFLGRDYTNTQKNFSMQIAFEIDQEIRKIIEDAHEKARQILEQYKEDVVLIAETLLKRETITAREIEYLIEHRNLPDEGIRDIKVETKMDAQEDKKEEQKGEGQE